MSLVMIPWIDRSASGNRVAPLLTKSEVQLRGGWLG